MANRIGNSPRALLGALGMKVGGENPPFFADSVVPVLDIYDQYLAELAGISAAQVATIPAGTPTGAITHGVQNAGITWRVFAIGCYTDLAAGADAGQDSNMSLWLIAPDGNELPITSLEYFVTQTQRTLGLFFPRPFWLPPGWLIGARAVLSGAPANQWTLTLRVAFNRVVE